MRKRPNPTFLQKAEGLKNMRRKRTLIIALSVLAVVLVVVFISSVASMQERYRESFPELVGAATSTTDSWERYTRATHKTETETTTTETESETTRLAPVIVTTATEETTEEATATSQNNAPDTFDEGEDFHFRTSYPHRTVSYQEREVLLDSLKEQVVRFQKDNQDMRICFELVCLETGEVIGVDELDPVVPSGCWVLPADLVALNRVANGRLSMSKIITYESPRFTDSPSYINSTYTPGKQFYLRTLMRYAVALNDTLAMNYLVECMGGLESIIPDVDEISGYISYSDQKIYQDYRNLEFQSTGLTSCYDMSAYLEYLYSGYTNTPDVYQPLINDMYNSETSSPIKEAFGEDASVLHILGRNTAQGAYMDIALIDADEPVALVIYCEASSADRAGNAILTIAGYAASFIDACH